MTPARAQEFRATADRSEVSLSGVVRVTYTFENVDVDDFNPPDFSPFEAYGPSQSRNMSWINGKMTQSVSYTYTLKPTREGAFEIPAAVARLDGKVQKSNPISIKVTASADAGTGGNDNRTGGRDDINTQIGDNLFVRAIPGKTRVYQGEQLTLTYKLYYAVSLDDLSIKKMPVFEGFLSQDIELTESEKRPVIETYNGRQYNTQILHRSALFPNQAGQYTIDPMELQAAVLLRMNDPGFFFPRTERRRFDFKSPAVNIQVDPLPAAGKPASFNGAVGDYRFSVEYDRTETQVDEPITLKINVSGQGNIKLVNAAAPEFPQSFEVYDPKVQESVSRKSAAVTGSKTWEYLLIPRGGGSFQFPDMEFSWFNPATGTYETSRHEGPLVEVTGEALSPSDYPAGGFGKEDVDLLGEDIRYIKTEAGKGCGAQPHLIGRPVFRLLAWLPVFLAMFLPFAFRARRKMLGDADALRRRQAGKTARNRLRHARKLQNAGDDKAFYGELARALREYLAGKLSVPPADLDRETIRKRTAVSGDAALGDDIVALLDQCEMAVYAPGATAGKEALLNQTEAIIDRLEKNLGKS